MVVEIKGSADMGAQSIIIDGVDLSSAVQNVDVAIGCEGRPSVVVRCMAHKLNSLLEDAKVKLVVHDVSTDETVELDVVEFAPRGGETNEPEPETKYHDLN